MIPVPHVSECKERQTWNLEFEKDDRSLWLEFDRMTTEGVKVTYLQETEGGSPYEGRCDSQEELAELFRWLDEGDL